MASQARAAATLTRHTLENLRAFGERHWIALAAEGLLALGGVIFTHDELLRAILFAAGAAFGLEVAVVEAERYRTRHDRRRGTRAVGEAARELVLTTLQQPDSPGPLSVSRRTVTLLDIGGGQELDLADSYNATQQLVHVREVIADIRQRFAATLGVQQLYLEESVRHAGATAVDELNVAMHALSQLEAAWWRQQAIWSAGIRGEASNAYATAITSPFAADFYRAARNACDLFAWLIEGRGWTPKFLDPPRVDEKATGAARNAAARRVVTALIEATIKSGPRSNWYRFSTIAEIESPTLETLGALADLNFIDQGIRYGWASINDGLREDSRYAGWVVNAISVDLSAEELAASRAFVALIEQASVDARVAADAEGHAIDVRVKERPPVEIAEADATFASSRQTFLQCIRDVLTAARGGSSDHAGARQGF